MEPAFIIYHLLGFCWGSLITIIVFDHFRERNKKINP
jgi:hypothetical protein